MFLNCHAFLTDLELSLKQIIVNVLVFLMQSFGLTVLTFRVNFVLLSDLSFFILELLKQLNSTGGSSMLKVL